MRNTWSKRMTHLLVFAGSRKSGKTLISSIVIDLDPRFKRISFADPLREEFCNEHEIDISELTDNKKKEGYRWEIIDFGESKTKDYPFYWANKWQKKIREEEYVVTDDLRKIAEIQRVVDN